MRGGGGLKVPPHFGGCEDRDILWAFFMNLSIYLQNYVKNGLIFKTINQRNFFFNTVHNLISFSMVFTNKNRGAL